MKKWIIKLCSICLALYFTALPLNGPALAAAEEKAAHEEVLLHIQGHEMNGELDNPVLKEKYPHIHWVGNDKGEEEQMQTTARAILTREGYDLYAISYQNYYDRLIEKEYALDLSSNPALMEAVNKMHPFIKEALLKEGKLYGVPTQIEAQAWAYSAKGFEQAGLPLDRLPKNYGELLDLLTWWVEEGNYDNDKMLFHRGGMTRACFVSDMTDSIMDYNWYNNKPMNFDSPEVLALFEKLDAIETEKIDDFTNQFEEGDIYDYGALFEQQYDWASLTPYDMEVEFEPIPLPIFKGQTKSLPMHLKVFIVNPLSRYTREAMIYLTCLQEGQWTLENTIGALPWALYEDAKPLLNEKIAQELKKNEEKADQLKKVLAGGEGDKQQLKEELKALERTIDVDIIYQWQVSPKDLGNYQKLLPYSYIARSSPLGSSGVDAVNIEKVQEEYIARRITAKEYLSQIQRIINQAMMELA